MALTSTLFTGLSGLDVNQTKLNVVGNNIANVNTVGFKSSRALFKPQFYVTDNAGSPASANFGGENPSQRGLGATVASIEKDFSPGAIEATGKATDLAIDGDGFFVVQGKEQKYTRDGSFTLNQANQLVTTAGDFVQGFGVDANGKVLDGTLQNIQIPLGSLTEAKATANASFQGNLNADGQVATGASILNSDSLTAVDGLGAQIAPGTGTALTDLRDPSDLTTPLLAAGQTFTVTAQRGGRDQAPSTYTIGAGDTVQNLMDFFNQAVGVDTTVTPPTGSPTPGADFNPIAGDAANTARLILVGNTGTDNELSLSGAAVSYSGGTSPLTFSDGQDATGNISGAAGESVNTGFDVYDSLGTPLHVDLTAVLDGKDNTGTTWRFYATSTSDTDAGTFDPTAATQNGSIVGTGTLKFDTDGKLVSSSNATIQIDRTNTGALSPSNIALDFSGMTALTSTQSNMLNNGQDGLKIGSLTSFSVGANGIITGAFDNGLTSTLGEVAIATFDNPQGLVDQGGNMFTSASNSGLAKITAPLTLTAGSIRAGALEASNVDLSKEFINMIVASSGFSAASRVISTSDQLLTELLNTSR